jgi:hypothetical protein
MGGMGRMGKMASGWMKSGKETLTGSSSSGSSSGDKTAGSVAAPAAVSADGEAGGAEVHMRSATVGDVPLQDREQWDESEAVEESYRFAADIIQDVVLLGTPVGTNASLVIANRNEPGLIMMLSVYRKSRGDRRGLL